MLRARRTEARSTHPQGVYCKANCKPRCEASDAKHPNTGPRHLSTLESALNYVQFESVPLGALAPTPCTRWAAGSPQTLVYHQYLR